MTDKPILFSGPMVRALLAGRKTQTRRVLDRIWSVLGASWRGSKSDEAWGGLRFDEGVARNGSDPNIGVPWCHPDDEPTDSSDCGIYKVRPPYSVGDRLWVREMWRRQSYSYFDPDRDFTETQYAAECDSVVIEALNWKPSIHMPRWASRITLIVTDVRVQRLQDISREDAAREGFGVLSKPGAPSIWDSDPLDEFCEYWNSLYEKTGHGWDMNPWVCALTFNVHKQNIDAMREVA